MTRMPYLGRWLAGLSLAASPLTLSSHVGRLRPVQSHTTEPVGLTVADTRRNGPVITSLRSGGLAERGGIAVGDIVQAVDGHTTRGAASVRHDLRHAHHCRVAINLRRGGRPLVATVARCGRTVR